MKKKSPSSLLLTLLLTLGIVSAPLPAPAFAYPQAAGNFREYQTRQPLNGKIIVVDPGHGGNDAGAIGPNNIVEKNVTLAIAHDLQELLSKDGATVIMTRTSDRNVANGEASDIEELQARANIANQANADLFISIHTDSFAEEGSGTTTYFSSGSDSSLAHFVQSSMVSQLKLYDRGSLPSDYYVLRHTNMPAILTEAAFISNPEEEKLLAKRDFKKKVAAGIYNGIKQYFLM